MYFAIFKLQFKNLFDSILSDRFGRRSIYHINAGVHQGSVLAHTRILAYLGMQKQQRDFV